MQKIFIKGAVQKSEKKSSDGQDVFTITASTGAVDRQGDSVDQNGWDLKNFNKNPVLLWAHDYSELPIGKVVSAVVIKGELIADFVFAPADANPKAEQVRKLYEGGFLNASSVGFIPLERQGNKITRSELLELSLVPVPANQEALRRGIETKSLDVSLIATDLQKGAIADEVNLEEMWEMKWEKFGEVQDVISAFWKVYFDENTSVESFGQLLDETIVLLQQLNNGTQEEEKGAVGKAISPETTKEFSVVVTEKSGKVLSQKNKDLINGAVSAMKAAVTDLENLVSASSNESDTEEKKVETDTTATKGAGVEETVTLSVTEFVKTLRNGARASAKANEETLAIISNFLKGRNE